MSTPVRWIERCEDVLILPANPAEWTAEQKAELVSHMNCEKCGGRGYVMISLANSSDQEIAAWYRQKAEDVWGTRDQWMGWERCEACNPPPPSGRSNGPIALTMAFSRSNRPRFRNGRRTR